MACALTEHEGVPVRLSKEGLKTRLGQTGRLAITTFALLAPLPTPAAEGGPDLIPLCGGPFQLCGYIEKNSREERIPPQFEVAHPFSEGLAAVRIEGRYGFIDTTGKVVIAPSFHNAGLFAGEYAEVRLGDASGIINRSGVLVISPRFQRIIPFTGDTFIAEPLREKQRKNPHSDRRLRGFTDPFSLISMEHAGLFHIRRGWLSDQNLKFARFDHPQRGLIWAGKSDGMHEELWGLMRPDGTWQVSPRYHHVQQLTEAHAVVAGLPADAPSPQQRRDTQRWGAVDRNGKLVVPLKFEHLSYWRGGYGIAQEGKPLRPDGAPGETKQGIVRPDGTLLADRYFDAVDIKDDGKLPRGRLGKTWYSINPSGHLIPDQLDGTPLVECAEGLTVVQRGETVEFRKSGQSQSVGTFDSGHFHSKDCPGPFSAKRNGKWFFILEDGAVIGGRNGFESLYGFRGNHAAVQVDGKWGIIDRAGTFTIQPSLTTLRPVGNGAFIVGESKDTYWINAYGDRIAKPAKERPPAEQALTCAGGLRFFEQDGLWGFQDFNGKTVIEPRFRALSCFEQGVSWAAAPDARAWCAIGPNGQRRDGIECRETYHPRGSSHYYPEQLGSTPYESSVLWNRALLEYRARTRDNPPKWVGDGVRGRGSFDAE